MMKTIFENSLWHRTREKVSSEAKAFAQAFVNFETLAHELEGKNLLPGYAANRIKALEVEDASHLSPDALTDRADLLNTLRKIANEPSVQNDARRSLLAKFADMEQPLAALVEAVKKEFAVILEEHRKAEAEFFETHLLDHEPTSLTTRTEAALKSFLAQVQTFTTAMDNLRRHPTGAAIPQFDFEGIVGVLFETAE